MLDKVLELNRNQFKEIVYKGIINEKYPPEQYPERYYVDDKQIKTSEPYNQNGKNILILHVFDKDSYTQCKNSSFSRRYYKDYHDYDNPYINGDETHDPDIWYEPVNITCGNCPDWNRTFTMYDGQILHQGEKIKVIFDDDTLEKYRIPMYTSKLWKDENFRFPELTRVVDMLLMGLVKKDGYYRGWGYVYSHDKVSGIKMYRLLEFNTQYGDTFKKIKPVYHTIHESKRFRNFEGKQNGFMYLIFWILLVLFFEYFNKIRTLMIFAGILIYATYFVTVDNTSRSNVTVQEEDFFNGKCGKKWIKNKQW